MEWNVIRRSKTNMIVSIIAEIKNNNTGEVREYHTSEILENDEEFPNIFIWREGNYSCDCNRLLFFKRAKNEEATDKDLNVECSGEKYSVNLKNPNNNYIYYKEY